MYVVGLGNLGEKYATTRHNVGWMVLDRLRSKFECTAPNRNNHWNARISECQLGTGESVVLVYPQTFMNRSGETVRLILRDKADASVIVVHDDIALPVGKIRVSQGKGHGGHNGIKSIMEHTKRIDLVRVRVGVAGKRWWGSDMYIPTGAALPKHVLSGFSWWERGAVEDGIERAAQAVQMLATEDVSSVMNIYNTDPS